MLLPNGGLEEEISWVVCHMLVFHILSRIPSRILFRRIHLVHSHHVSICNRKEKVF